jgi:Uma2 family endonuclease
MDLFIAEVKRWLTVGRYKWKEAITIGDQNTELKETCDVTVSSRIYDEPMNEETRMVAEALREYKRYTVDEFMSWDENVRAELYDGEVRLMAEPTTRHQSVAGEIFGQLWQFLKGKPCKVFHAPVGVCLSDNEDTVFEPDIIVVCDKTKLDGKKCNGAPDLVVEVLSPSSVRYDKIRKYDKYREAGVREYWIVDPDKNTLQANILVNGTYIATMYTDTDVAPVSVLEGCAIDLAEVFAE